MKRFMISALGLGVLAVGISLGVQGTDKKPAVSFGQLEAATPEAARAKAEAWLKEVGKTDPATTAKVQAIWAQDDRSVLDRLADTLALGDERAAKLMAEARNPLALAPTTVPALFSDDKAPLFFRANLALAYARALSNRRIHEEALKSLQLFQPEQVVAPATFLFTRAVCEHATLQKQDATRTITRLLDESVSTPERYKTVSALMLLDMQMWKDKDLGAIARKMENIERRLDLARGGPETQKMQKEVIARLDELIKELENKAKKPGDGKGDGPPNDGSCPSGGQQPGSGSQPGSQPGKDPTAPMQDSKVGGQGGTGAVDPAKMKRLLERWNGLPPREQARALQDLTRGMSPKHREAIENYFRNIAGGR